MDNDKKRETLAELRERLAWHEAEERILDHNRRQAQGEKWAQIMDDPASFEWTVDSERRSSWWDDDSFPGFRVSCRVRPEILVAWREGGPSTFSQDIQEPDRWFGMFYFRTEESIITNEGGGHHVLDTPKLCSDEEWARISRGDIPEKFIKKKKKKEKKK